MEENRGNFYHFYANFDHFYTKIDKRMRKWRKWRGPARARGPFAFAGRGQEARTDWTAHAGRARVTGLRGLPVPGPACLTPRGRGSLFQKVRARVEDVGQPEGVRA